MTPDDIDGQGDGLPAPIIRAARASDLGDITAIYNHYVLDSTATYQNEPDSLEDRERWFAAHGPGHPVLVCELAGEVIGWGALSRFHPRSAYQHTVEDSLYVHYDYHRQGIGRLLLEELIRLAASAGHHSIIALISADQEPSLHLHARLGFVESGRLREVGWKFSRWLDVVYLQKHLPPKP
jgi:phosphinothricin acetyltransferase